MGGKGVEVDAGKQLWFMAAVQPIIYCVSSFLGDQTYTHFEMNRLQWNKRKYEKEGIKGIYMHFTTQFCETELSEAMKDNLAVILNTMNGCDDGFNHWKELSEQIMINLRNQSNQGIDKMDTNKQDELQKKIVSFFKNKSFKNKK
eukprot:365354_1